MRRDADLGATPGCPRQAARVQQQLGELWSYGEFTGACLVAAEAGASERPGGLWLPEVGKALLDLLLRLKSSLRVRRKGLANGWGITVIGDGLSAERPDDVRIVCIGKLPRRMVRDAIGLDAPVLPVR